MIGKETPAIKINKAKIDDKNPVALLKVLDFVKYIKLSISTAIIINTEREKIL